MWALAKRCRCARRSSALRVVCVPPQSCDDKGLARGGERREMRTGGRGRVDGSLASSDHNAQGSLPRRMCALLTAFLTASGPFGTENCTISQSTLILIGTFPNVESILSKGTLIYTRALEILPGHLWLQLSHTYDTHRRPGRRPICGILPRHPFANKETLVTGAVQDSPSGALRALAEHSSVGSLVARGSCGGSLTPPWTPT